MIVDGVDPWLPDQGTETLDEGFWFKEQGACTIGPWPLQREDDSSIGSLLDSVERQWWSSDVAAQALQPVSLPSSDAYVCVEVESADGGASSREGGLCVSEQVALLESGDGLVGVFAEDGPSSGGCAVEGVFLFVGVESVFE